MNKDTDIFSVQPESCRVPLPHKEFDQDRTAYPLLTAGPSILFDPSEVYAHMGHRIDPFHRVQSTITLATCFPKIDGLCSCRCGNPAKWRWYKNHGNIGYHVCKVIQGTSSIIRTLLGYYYGYVCSYCQEDFSTRLAYLDADHIVPVKHGGGGCWLSNYQWLCHDCHVGKTNNDFGWKQSGRNQLELFN